MINPFHSYSSLRGTWQVESLIAKSGKVREFRTVEAALSVLADVGFKKASIAFE